MAVSVKEVFMVSRVECGGQREGNDTEEQRTVRSIYIFGLRKGRDSITAYAFFVRVITARTSTLLTGYDAEMLLSLSER